MTETRHVWGSNTAKIFQETPVPIATQGLTVAQVLDMDRQLDLI